jgi:hypothetical protein
MFWEFPDSEWQPDDVEKQMHLFIRDDFMAWFKAQGRNPSTDNLLEFRMSVAQAIEKIIQRMASMTGETERKKARLSLWCRNQRCSFNFTGNGCRRYFSDPYDNCDCRGSATDQCVNEPSKPV